MLWTSQISSSTYWSMYAVWYESSLGIKMRHAHLRCMPIAVLLQPMRLRLLTPKLKFPGLLRSDSRGGAGQRGGALRRRQGRRFPAAGGDDESRAAAGGRLAALARRAGVPAAAAGRPLAVHPAGLPIAPIAIPCRAVAGRMLGRARTTLRHRDASRAMEQPCRRPKVTVPLSS